MINLIAKYFLKNLIFVFFKSFLRLLWMKINNFKSTNDFDLYFEVFYSIFMSAKKIYEDIAQRSSPPNYSNELQKYSIFFFLYCDD